MITKQGGAAAYSDVTGATLRGKIILFCKICKADYLDNLQTVELYHSRLYTPLAIDFHVFVSGAVASAPLGIRAVSRGWWVPVAGAQVRL